MDRASRVHGDEESKAACRFGRTVELLSQGRGSVVEIAIYNYRPLLGLLFSSCPNSAPKLQYGMKSARSHTNRDFFCTDGACSKALFSSLCHLVACSEDPVPDPSASGMGGVWLTSPADHCHWTVREQFHEGLAWYRFSARSQPIAYSDLLGAGVLCSQDFDGSSWN